MTRDLKSFYIEPDYPEDQESMKLIEEKAKAWNKSQRINTPRGNVAEK